MSLLQEFVIVGLVYELVIMRKDKRFELRIDADTLDRFTGFVGKGKRSKVIISLIKSFNAKEAAKEFYTNISKKQKDAN